MSLTKKILLFDALPLLACLTSIWMMHRHQPEKVLIPFKAKPESVVVSSIDVAKPEVAAPIPEPEPETTKKGAHQKRKLSSSVLHPGRPDTVPYLAFEPMMFQAMYEQANYLRRRDTPSKGASGISKSEMLRTVELLQSIQLLDPNVLLTTFDFYSINTDLKKDKVRVTGYYTPLIKASRVQTPEFPCPMLKRPESGIPSPAAIEAGALAGKGLELAWLSSQKELRNAQLQGSCLIEFPDGKREHFGFGGSVKGAGGTYVFFKEVDEQVLGAGFFPLSPGYSVAVDTRYIPIGSTLLAELPNIDASGKLKGYTYRIIFAQDRGGAIKTTKRIDLYCGMGQKGLQEARKVNRFGRLWLLLPKEK
ncbi:MAG: MltA domain-containing protein [Saprospiraceae bacterium]|nr:MltA domain-containing protein [Saprospiraceae bacterium]